MRLEPSDPNHKRPDKRDLVYFEVSPDFCERDEAIGFPGTTGRECNATSIGIDGCDLLCCGRGFKSEQYTVRERCSCTFHWCCEVKCKICTRTKIRHTCLWRGSSDEGSGNLAVDKDNTHETIDVISIWLPTKVVVWHKTCLERMVCSQVYSDDMYSSIESISMTSFCY